MNHKKLNYSAEEINELLNKVDDIKETIVNVKDFGAKGDGITDDTAVVSNDLKYTVPLLMGSGFS